jgi:hypothetical protein
MQAVIAGMCVLLLVPRLAAPGLGALLLVAYNTNITQQYMQALALVAACPLALRGPEAKARTPA